MDPLALVSDITSRYGGTLPAGSTGRIPSLLIDASAVVRSYTRQDFTASTTTERIRPIGDRVRLPQTPVTAVLNVAIVDPLESGGMLTLPLGVWLWDGGQELWLGGLRTVINLPDELTHLLEYQTPLMQVTYTHGWAAVPDAAVSVVCSMVSRAVDMPGPTSVIMQKVGELTYKIGTTAQDGVLGLTDAEQRMLAPYRRAANTVELR